MQSPAIPRHRRGLPKGTELLTDRICDGELTLAAWDVAIVEA
jgi:hypothetical protein